MPTRRRSRGSSKRGGRYLWIPTFVDPATQTQDTKTLTHMTATVEEDVLQGSTLIRIVGTWGCKPLADDLDGAAALSFVKMSLEQFEAANGFEVEVDNPDTLWFDVIYTQMGTLASQGQVYIQHTVDTKAKRRLKGEDVIVAQRENISLDNVSLLTTFSCRMLLWVP